MKSFKKIIHEVHFSDFTQHWEISLKWDLESVENVKVMAHNYHENKFTHSTDITDTKKLYDSKIQNLNEQIRSLEEQNQQKSGIISTLKATIEVKDG